MKSCNNEQWECQNFVCEASFLRRSAAIALHILTTSLLFIGAKNEAVITKIYRFLRPFRYAVTTVFARLVYTNLWPLIVCLNKVIFTIFIKLSLQYRQLMQRFITKPAVQYYASMWQEEATTEPAAQTGPCQAFHPNEWDSQDNWFKVTSFGLNHGFNFSETSFIKHFESLIQLTVQTSYTVRIFGSRETFKLDEDMFLTAFEVHTRMKWTQGEFWRQR